MAAPTLIMGNVFFSVDIIFIFFFNFPFSICYLLLALELQERNNIVEEKYQIAANYFQVNPPKTEQSRTCCLQISGNKSLESNTI